MLLAILTIILIGLVLVFLEVFLIPGTTLFGVAGGVALVVGVLLVYVYYDMKWGNIAAGVTALAVIIAVIIAVIGGFKVIQSNKLAMKAEITGRVNELEKNLFAVGDKGIAFTEIRPNGKGLFNDNKVDIYSNGEYIERGTAVEITRIDKDKIFVKTI